MSWKSHAGHRGEAAAAAGYLLLGAEQRLAPSAREASWVFSSEGLFFRLFLSPQGMFPQQKQQGGLKLHGCRGSGTGSSRQPTKTHLQDKLGHASSSTSFLACGKRGLTCKFAEKSRMASDFIAPVRFKGVWWYLGSGEKCRHDVGMEVHKQEALRRLGKREEWGR